MSIVTHEGKRIVGLSPQDEKTVADAYAQLREPMLTEKARKVLTEPPREFISPAASCYRAAGIAMMQRADALEAALRETSRAKSGA